jgi:hypothetical protein
VQAEAVAVRMLALEELEEQVAGMVVDNPQM